MRWCKKARPLKIGTVIPYLKKIQKVYKSPDTSLDVLKRLPAFLQLIITLLISINLLDLNFVDGAIKTVKIAKTNVK